MAGWLFGSVLFVAILFCVTIFVVLVQEDVLCKKEDNKGEVLRWYDRA